MTGGAGGGVAADAALAVAQAPLLVARLRHWARVRPDAVAWAAYAAGGARPSRTLTWAQWVRAVDAAAAALLRDGVAPGDRVAVFAGNRLLWPVLDLALQQLRAVGVGLYPTGTAVQVAELLEDRALSFLPFSHAAERMFGEGTRLVAGMATALVEDPADLFAVCADFAPTVVGGLPRIFERVYERTEAARRSGGDPRAALEALLGPRVRLATSGGAPLPMVAEALGALGCPIVGAYGQTEHLCVAMHRPAAPRTEGVGAPMPGTAVRVADDGELLVRRSALTFSGYWGRPEETAAAFTADGAWLRTGDRAEVEGDGTLRITGRIKERIALSTGRKVAPLPIEGALADTPLIAHAVCHGEGRKHLVALLALRRPVVEAWARERALPASWEALLRHPALRAELAAAVEGVNAGLPRTDRVVAWAVTDAEWSVDSGELTPTLKVRRAEVEARHAALLASLYAPHPSAA